MKCDLILSALTDLQCHETSDGARVLTHCLYPTFSQVAVFVQSHLDGFLVHDGGAGFDLAFDEGHNPNALKALMRDYAALYGAETDGHRIFARARGVEWLSSVAMSVANASAAAATALVAGPSDDRQEEREFREKTYHALWSAFTPDNVSRKFRRKGRTGKLYTFAFGVTYKGRVALVDTVTPNPLSIASRFTSFSAVGGRGQGGAYLAHKKPLSNEDSALLAEVADVVPLEALIASIERGFAMNRVIQ